MKTTRKPKPTRSTFTPELLVKQLAKDVPGFKAEVKAVQAALAALVWIGHTKYRQHTVHDGYMSFHHKELSASFGRHFNAINKRLRFFDVKDTYRFDSKVKATDTFTKGYRFTPVVQKSRERFIANKVRRLTRLLDAKGTAFRKPPKAVASVDMDGVSTSRWKSINLAGSLSLVPVNIDSLKVLHRDLGKKISAWNSAGQRPQDLLMEYPSLEYLNELRNKTKQIIIFADTDVAGLGNVMHHYVESDSGRLYAQGGASLANAPTVIRQAALAGMWDYDVENCHFAITAQMAERAGFQCVAIQNYMENKRAVRSEIANAIGISIGQTKTCLLAVMYGARTTTWHENAIPQAIGQENAGLLSKLPLFSNIATDVKLARDAILARTPPNRQGNLVNAFGKSLKVNGKVEEKTPEQRLAHLIQGVEALALEACTNLHPYEIILLQHDGFTATKPLVVAALEQAIKTATGYELRLERKSVFLDLAGQFGKGFEAEFSKAQKMRKLNAGEGFQLFNTSPLQANSAP